MCRIYMFFSGIDSFKIVSFQLQLFFANGNLCFQKTFSGKKTIMDTHHS